MMAENLRGEAVMTPTVFRIESIDDATFAGYDMGRTWNGWEWPLFTFEVANHIVAAARVWNTARYDTDADEFVFAFAPGETEERFGSIEVDGQKLYAIGKDSWFWKKLTD